MIRQIRSIMIYVTLIHGLTNRKLIFILRVINKNKEVIYSRKIKVTVHTQLVFSNNAVHETSTQKHLAMFLHVKLNSQEHFESMLNKVNKTIGLLRKLHSTLPRPSLLTVYKSFIRPSLWQCCLGLSV